MCFSSGSDIGHPGDLWDITLKSQNLDCCVLSVSQERVPVRFTLLNFQKAAHSNNNNNNQNKCPQRFLPLFPLILWKLCSSRFILQVQICSSPCDQCVPITQSDIDGVWHARVVMDYERSYIYIYIYLYIYLHTVVLLAICDVLARTLLYRFAQYKVVLKKLNNIK